MNLNNLKLKFSNYQKIEKNYSQSNQDLFVLTCLDGKESGYFLDLGCNDPINISNTYLLEKQFNWSGIAIDIDDKHIKNYKNVRSCKAICQDCTLIDYENLLQETNHIDYLSLDLEPASITFNCLKKIPFEKLEFSVITFEHDFYRFGNFFREESRKIFEHFGYQILCSDVKNCGNAYEDWYVNPKYVDLQRLQSIKCDGMEYTDILLHSV